MSTGQSSNPSPFNDLAAQNGGPNQQGSQLQSNPSIVSQPSGYQQQQPSAQPPFLVQYGNNNQGELLMCLMYKWSSASFPSRTSPLQLCSVHVLLGVQAQAAACCVLQQSQSSLSYAPCISTANGCHDCIWGWLLSLHWSRWSSKHQGAKPFHYCCHQRPQHSPCVVMSL